MYRNDKPAQKVTLFNNTNYLTETSLEKAHQEIYNLSKNIIERSRYFARQRIATDKEKINLLFTDYITENIGVGVCELWGERTTQEDSIKGISLDDIVVLFTNEQWQVILLETFAATQSKVLALPDNASDHEGACVCAATVIGQTIINANLGDSEAILVTLNDDQVEVKQINKLHNLENSDERKRIEKLGGNVASGRLWEKRNSIMVTRSFGDESFNSNRTFILHVPDIVITEVPSQGKSFLILACDGLREGLTNRSRVSNEAVENIIAMAMKKFIDAKYTPQQMAQKLAVLSYKYGSRDNISVAVIPITELALHTKHHPLFYFVADGHGGVEVTHLLFDHFIPQLQITLAEKVQHCFQDTQNQLEKYVQAAENALASIVRNFFSTNQENRVIAELARKLIDTINQFLLSQTITENSDLAHDITTLLPNLIESARLTNVHVNCINILVGERKTLKKSHQNISGQ